MSEPNGSRDSGNERLDRIERALNLMLDDHIQFREEHKLLLSAQVQMQGGLEQLRTDLEALTRTVEAQGRNIEAQARTVEAQGRNIDAIGRNIELMRQNFDERLKRIEPPLT